MFKTFLIISYTYRRPVASSADCPSQRHHTSATFHTDIPGTDRYRSATQRNIPDATVRKRCPQKMLMYAKR